MADFKFDKNAHLIGYYATLPATNDALVFIVLQASGLGTDATLRTQDTLAQVLANATEHPMGRQTAATTRVTVDKTSHVVDIDVDDPTWTKPTGTTTGKLLVCYGPDMTTGTDADLVLLTGHDWTNTPDGAANLVATIAASGLYHFA